MNEAGMEWNFFLFSPHQNKVDINNKMSHPRLGILAAGTVRV